MLNLYPATMQIASYMMKAVQGMIELLHERNEQHNSNNPSLQERNRALGNAFIRNQDILI